MANEKWKQDRIKELNKEDTPVETFTKCHCTDCDCHKDALFEICAYCAKGLHHVKDIK